MGCSGSQPSAAPSWTHGLAHGWKGLSSLPRCGAVLCHLPWRRASGRQGESWGLLLCLTMRLWTQAAGEPLGATACVQWQVARAQSLWGGASGDRRGVGRQQASTRSWSPVWGSEGTGVAAGSTRGREGKHVSQARSPRSPRAGCCELREGRGRTDSRHCIVAALAPCSAEIWCPVDTR